MNDKLTINDIEQAVSNLKANQRALDKEGLIGIQPPFYNLNWNFTPCLTQFGYDHEGYPVKEYFFYIVDYNLPDNVLDYEHIIEMRNKGIVKTKYFHTEKEAVKFLSKYIKKKVRAKNENY